MASQIIVTDFVQICLNLPIVVNAHQNTYNTCTFIDFSADVGVKIGSASQRCLSKIDVIVSSLRFTLPLTFGLLTALSLVVPKLI